MLSSPQRSLRILALLCAVQFVAMFDVSAVSVALPSVQRDLGLGNGSVQWVLSAYALTFAGFLLLGGRAADLLGRGRVLAAGLVLVAAGSLAAALASRGDVLIGARALQGVGTAIAIPAALSLLTTTFGEGRERNRALGVWGAVSGLGSAAGMVAGGLVADVLGWQWLFLAEVPLSLALVAAVPLVLPRRDPREARGFDVTGAVLATAGLSLTVLAITSATSTWRSPLTTGGLLLGSVMALAGFVLVELRARDPLVSFSIFRVGTVGAANLIGLVHGMLPVATFLLLTLYLQDVLGYSGLQTGLAFLAVASTSVVWSPVASHLVTRLGAKAVLVTGRILLVLGLFSFTRLPLEGAYLRDVLPGLLIVGVGLPLSYVSISAAALAGLGSRHAGLGSALVSTSQQIGGALGIAILSAVAAMQTRSAGRGGEALAPALLSGYRAAFWVGTAIAVVGLLTSILLLRDEERCTAPDCGAAPASA
jgi:EmrB/QacA subfamily drug resistance transporter